MDENASRPSQASLLDNQNIELVFTCLSRLSLVIWAQRYDIFLTLQKTSLNISKKLVLINYTYFSLNTNYRELT